MTYPATSRATELLGFIEAYSARHGGLAPSYNEMRVHLGLSAKSGVHRLLTQLEERGMVRRLPNRARAVEVAHCPAITIPPALYQKAKLKAEQSGERLDDIVTDFLRFFIDSE